MSEIIILAFSAFFIVLLGTKWVISTLRNKAPSPDIEVLMGRRAAPPIAAGGIAITFALIIGFLGADVDYTVIFSMFALAASALVGGVIKLPTIVKWAVRILAVVVPLLIWHAPIFSPNFSFWLDKTIAALFWLLMIHSFDKFEDIEGMLPVQMLSVGLGLAVVTVIAEHFPSPLAEQSLILAGVGFGFLWWNWKPAKVMAGKIGTVPAGFAAGYLLLLAMQNGYVAAALILPAYFLISSADFDAHYRKDDWMLRLILGVNMLLLYLAVAAILSPEMLIFNIVIAYLTAIGLEFFLSSNPQKNAAKSPRESAPENTP